tara:strand:- start:4214 stop:5002 length:789 start_codon:yes stop_codon:yes gene_type:complete
MFYIKHFYNIITFKTFKGIVFLGLSLSLVLSVFFNSEINNQVNALFKQKNAGPYFHALLNGDQNSSRISRKLKSLPGVKSVKIVAQNDLKKQVSDIINADQLQIDSSLFDLDLVGMKVEFANGISVRSQELIRDYLVRLVGQNNVSLGAVKAILEKVKAKKFLFFMSKWGGDLVSLIILGLWYLALLFMVDSFDKTSYLVEQFQRRSNVSVKSFLAAFSIIAVASSATYFVQFNQLNFGVVFLFAPLVIGALHFTRKYKWEN